MDIGPDGEMFCEALRFGYVVENGETYGLVSARVETSTTDMISMGCWFEASDTRGKVHRCTGTIIAGHPFDNFTPSHIAFQSLMRWETPEGRVGCSEMANIFGREFIAARISRHAKL